MRPPPPVSRPVHWLRCPKRLSLGLTCAKLPRKNVLHEAIRIGGQSTSSRDWRADGRSFSNFVIPCSTPARRLARFRQVKVTSCRLSTPPPDAWSRQVRKERP